MKFVPIICLLLLAATPAVAAPPWVEDLCWAKAARIAFMGRGDREHSMANCIADHTPPVPTERYKKRRYYEAKGLSPKRRQFVTCLSGLSCETFRAD